MKAYHISPIRNRESILKSGLVPHEKKSGRIKYEPRIFFSTDVSDLGFDYVDYENVDCWVFEVDSKKIKVDTFSGSTNHFYIKNPISFSEVKLFSSH